MKNKVNGNVLFRKWGKVDFVSLLEYDQLNSFSNFAFALYAKIKGIFA